MRAFLLTLVAMGAFAGNSLLCRKALQDTQIDAELFGAIRIGSGALMLTLLVVARGTKHVGGSWWSALALLMYVTGFTIAYLDLTAGVGALLLFAAVQLTMILYGYWQGERLRTRQVWGLVITVVGFLGLVLPGLSAPPIAASATMAGAGVAWGIYSLRGKGSETPLEDTAGNFLRASPAAILVAAVLLPSARIDAVGFQLAIISGALTSGIGYAIWYAAVRELSSTTAAVVQLSVPVITTAFGILLLGENLDVRLAASSLAIIGGITAVVVPGGKT